METLNFEAETALMKQFFGTSKMPDKISGSEGSRYLLDFTCRWKSFRTNTLLTKEVSVSQLWSNLEFRRAFFSLLDVVDVTETAWSGMAHQKEEYKPIDILEDIITMATEIEGHPLDFGLLIQAAEGLKKEVSEDNDSDDEDKKHYVDGYDMLIKDFRALMFIGKQVAECNAIVEKQNQELLDFLKPKSEEKRKPLKKAA